jgi:hypothetical protein
MAFPTQSASISSPGQETVVKTEVEVEMGRDFNTEQQ